MLKSVVVAAIYIVSAHPARADWFIKSADLPAARGNYKELNGFEGAGISLRFVCRDKSELTLEMFVNDRLKDPESFSIGRLIVGKSVYSEEISLLNPKETQGEFIYKFDASAQEIRNILVAWRLAGYDSFVEIEKSNGNLIGNPINADNASESYVNFARSCEVK